MSKPYIMQQDDAASPAFCLIECPTWQDAKERAFIKAQKRNKAGKHWPKWKVLGYTY